MRRYTTVSQPDSVDGWLAVQLGDKLWFPGWNSAVMAETAARIVPIVTGQERAAVSLQPSTPKSSSPLQAASIADPASGTSGATAAKTISNPNAASVSTLHLLHHLAPAHFWHGPSASHTDSAYTPSRSPHLPLAWRRCSKKCLSFRSDLTNWLPKLPHQTTMCRNIAARLKFSLPISRRYKQIKNLYKQIKKRCRMQLYRVYRPKKRYRTL